MLDEFHLIRRLRVFLFIFDELAFVQLIRSWSFLFVSCQLQNCGVVGVWIEMCRKRTERLALLVEQAPSRFVPVLLRFRYVALVAAFNLPGNAILGGGGGIALLAGMSGMFSLPQYLIAASIAALPIPAAALLFGRVFQ